MINVNLVIDGVHTRLVLAPASVRTPGYRVVIQRPDGQWVTITPPPALTYRGWIEVRSDAIAAASVFRNQLVAHIHVGDEVLTIQPLSPIMRQADARTHVVFWRDDIIPVGASCGNIADLAGPLARNAEWGPTVGCQDLSIAEIAYDADVEFYTASGSSIAAVVADIESITNAVNVIYERDVSITHEITEIRIRTAEPDPYTATSPSGLLNEFRTHWNANHSPSSGDYIARDIAHLMTGRDLDGNIIGIAHFDSVCDNLFSGMGYGLSQSTWSSNFDERVALTSHELGHNWSAVHCDAVGDCRIMCSDIGGCSGQITGFGPDSVASITAFRDTSPCVQLVNAPQSFWIGGTADWGSIGTWSSGVPTAVDAAIIQNGGTAVIELTPAAATCVLLGHDDDELQSGVVQHLAGALTADRVILNRSGAYELAGGVLDVASLISLSNALGTAGQARFDWLGGQIQTAVFNVGNGELNLGLNADLGALVDGSLIGGGMVHAHDGLDLWDLGIVAGAMVSLDTGPVTVFTLRIEDGGAFQLMPGGTLQPDRTIRVGGNGTAGTIIQTGGLLDVETAQSVVSDLVIGEAAGADGSYQLVDGEVAVHDDLLIGGFGAGHMHQFGGLVRADLIHAGNHINTGADGHGAYTLDGGDIESSFLVVGELDVTGHFTQNGGTVTLAPGGGTKLQMGSLGTLEGANPGAIYDLHDGTLQLMSQFAGGDVSGIVSIGFAGGALFRQSGGLFRAFEMLVGDRATSRYELSGGEVHAAAMFVGDAGSSIVDAVVEQSGGSVVMFDAPGTPVEGKIVLRTANWNQTGGSVIANSIQTAWRNNSFGFWDIAGGSIETTLLMIGENEGYGSSGGFFILSGPGALVQTADLLVGSEFGGSTGELRLLDAGATLIVSNSLRIGPLGSIVAVPGAAIHLTGSNVTNKSQDADNLAGLADVALVFEGGAADIDSLEVAGEDLGAVGQGFQGNFALGTLQVGGADVGRVVLVDTFENQAGSVSLEALYVHNVLVGAGSTLDLNGINVYYEHLSVDPAGMVSLNGGQLIETEVIVTCAGDVNVDGAVNVTDLLALLASWGACPLPCATGQVNDPDTCPTDLTRSCGVNISDLLNLLSAWGPCHP